MSSGSNRLGRGVSRIWTRLLAFNVLLVFIPAAGLLYLNTYERQLLAAQERGMVQQGRLLAAALAAPDGISAWDSERVLLRLHRRHQSRLRVIDVDGALLADSSRLGPRREPGAEGAARASGPRSTSLYRLGAWPFRLYRRLFRGGDAMESSSDYYTSKPRLLGQEVLAALAGRYGATTRISEGQASVTLYVAIPIRWLDTVQGAVLVSQSTLDILEMLDAVRLDIFRVVLISLAVAAVLSLLVSTTIARPLIRLRDEASQIVDERGRLTGSFSGSRRRDEIGDLSRALEQLTERLRGHVDFVESFASDVSHELKNPLAAIRSAGDLLADLEDGPQRDRMVAVINQEVARMERLVSAVRDIARLDAQSIADQAEPVDVSALVRALVAHSGKQAPDSVRLELEGLAEGPVVRAVPQQLEQVFANLLDNAVSFSPAGGTVSIAVGETDGRCVVSVADQGPGVPREHSERIFDRFFSFRPEEIGDDHVGLGLSIARAIVVGHGGEIAVGAGEAGARFEVRLPLA